MMIINPQHHLSIHNLSSRYDSYSETVRLFSLWIHYQNFSGKIYSLYLLCHYNDENYF